MYVASVFYLDVAYVSHICCKCFIWILHMFCNDLKCFPGVFL
jgi:energy-converting hydrogenase Eha subunit C